MSQVNPYWRAYSLALSAQGLAPPPPTVSDSSTADLIAAILAEKETESQKGTARELPIDIVALDNAPAPIPAMVGPVELSTEQDRILQLVLEGKNVFFTGSAGTGKSVLLREIIDRLRKRASAPDTVAVTASTGIAACNIGGVTLHSFSGAGLCNKAMSAMVAMVKQSKRARTRWERTEVLIIDEISMVDGDLFDTLEELSRTVRHSQSPFGGIQLIVTGDFFQLPPVNKNGQPKFAFEARLWSTVFTHTFNLKKVFRQKDPTFVEMLNEMRFGKLSAAHIDRFRSLSRAVQIDDGLSPTELFPLRRDVDKSNAAQLAELDKSRLPSWTYVAKDGGRATGDRLNKLLSSFMAVETLKLTQGSQVMLIKNNPDDRTLVNGSTGIVIGFRQRHAPPPGTPETSISSMPPWPVVRFKMPGKNAGTRDVMVGPETFTIELPDSEIPEARRSQLPLILSWAMSIHKSQGQTLDRVKVDLSKVFEKGQAYVALSRATSLEGLQVLGFDPAKVLAHPKVIEWNKSLVEIS